jgi:Cellulase (glycosyl hydrolase family 5)
VARLVAFAAAAVVFFGAAGIVARHLAGPLAVAGVAQSVVAPPSDRPLVTAIELPTDSEAGVDTMFARTAAAGARAVRLNVSWGDVAPKRTPAHWDPRDPGDPNYDWSALDRAVKRAQAHRLQVMLTVSGAPAWGQESPISPDRYGGNQPNAPAFGAFATALATRYDGAYGGLPRIRSFEVWNEPNLNLYLTPQVAGGVDVSPGVYRTMINTFADAVHRVRKDDLVIAGAVTPFTVNNTYVNTIGPLKFMREVMCLSNDGRLQPTCSAQVHMDAWSIHPYTSGNPEHHAINPNDDSLGDLAKVRAVLDAAVRAGHIVSSNGPVRLWVTEWSWDSKPPDPHGVPAQLEGRWVSEALYRMWSENISFATWFLLRDFPLPNDYQSGLYYSGKTMAQDRPKPALRAFQFPFVAFPRGKTVFYWGRTPTSEPGRLRIEIQSGGGWRPVATAQANRYGIFYGSFPSSATTGAVRARLGSSTTLPFDLKAPPDYPVTPFGVGPRS